MAGRGVYLCKDQKCWVDGVEKGRIARAFRSSLEGKDAAMIIAWAKNSFDDTDSDTAE